MQCRRNLAALFSSLTFSGLDSHLVLPLLLIESNGLAADNRATVMAAVFHRTGPSPAFSPASSALLQRFIPFAATNASIPPPLPPPPPSSAAEESSKNNTWPKLLLFVPGAISFGLGTWQLFRRQDKIEMLEYRKKRLESEPISWSQVHASMNATETPTLEFRKVVLEGDFDERQSIYIGPRSRVISGVTENGYYLITPFISRSNASSSLQQPVLVNRGWVPRGWRDKYLKDTGPAEKDQKISDHDLKADERTAWWKFWHKASKTAEIEERQKAPARVTGVVRQSENPSIFVPANDPSNGQWFYVDVPMIARTCGLPENTVYIEDINEDASATNPYPVPKDVNTLIRHSVMPQDHLNYTFTWYTLSAAVTFMAYKRIKAKNRIGGRNFNLR